LHLNEFINVHKTKIEELEKKAKGKYRGNNNQSLLLVNKPA